MCSLLIDFYLFSLFFFFFLYQQWQPYHSLWHPSSSQWPVLWVNLCMFKWKQHLCFWYDITLRKIHCYNDKNWKHDTDNWVSVAESNSYGSVLWKYSQLKWWFILDTHIWKCYIQFVSFDSWNSKTDTGLTNNPCRLFRGGWLSL